MEMEMESPLRSRLPAWLGLGRIVNGWIDR